MVQRQESKSARRGAGPDLGTWQELRLAFRLYRDPRVSTALKSIVPVLAALYVLSPIDLIPDFLIGLGQADDVGMLGLAFFAGLKLIRRWAPSQVVAEHLADMRLISDDAPTQSPSSTTADTEDVIDVSFRMRDRSNCPTTAGRGRGMA
ncbi:MAG: hypothetical protein QOF01_5011 [Thermomicrobiales bacterium]|jgi:uncharacterized membrane protein YkvA (DUF1232 family)|nr:hypothetical protein [Thermomicrobiales bacterium]